MATRQTTGAETTAARLSAAAAFAVAGIAALVLVGWALDIPVLKSVLDGRVTMKPNTALALGLAAAALGLLAPPPVSVRRRQLGTVAAAASALIGALTLVQYLGHDLGIDNLLFEEGVAAPETAAPGRMAPTTAAAFVALGAGLLALRVRWLAWLSEGTAALIGLLSMLHLIGYLYGVPMLEGTPPYTMMAVHTAAAFFVLALGLLAARPERWFVATLVGPGLGSRQARRLLPAILFLPILVGGLKLAGHEARWYGVEFGVSLVVFTHVAAFSALVLWLARSTDRLDVERRRAERSRDRFFSLAGDLFAIVDSDLRVRAVNAAWTRLLGWKETDLLGRPLLELIHPDDRQASLAEAHRLLEGGEPQPFENRYRGADGVYRRLQWAGGVPDDEGLLYASARDITERAAAALQEKLLLESEQRARAQAEEAGRLKDEFLAVLSHELRTPLSGMLGWSSLLVQPDIGDDAVRRRGLQAIHRNGLVLDQLVSDILDVSRIITGKLHLTTQPLSLEPIVSAALETMGPAARAKRIQVATAVDPGASRVMCDPQRLQQAVWNLLSNAIKFTPEGGAVTVRVLGAGEGVTIQVDDTGPGVPPEFLPYVFDRFRQADSSSTRRHGGLGLGLAIVRHLVELHGGTVHASNRTDRSGARFEIRLPPLPQGARTAGESSENARPARAAPDPVPSLAGLRVLLVDDDPGSLEVGIAILERCGAEVLVAASAREGLDAVQHARPDVVLSDIEMPTEDGYAFLEKLRELPIDRGGLTPAAALTAYVRPSDRLRSLQAGYQLHISKPIQADDLARAVAALAGVAHA